MALSGQWLPAFLRWQTLPLLAKELRVQFDSNIHLHPWSPKGLDLLDWSYQGQGLLCGSPRTYAVLDTDTDSSQQPQRQVDVRSNHHETSFSQAQVSRSPSTDTYLKFFFHTVLTTVHSIPDHIFEGGRFVRLPRGF